LRARRLNAFGQLGQGSTSLVGVAPGQMGDALPLIKLGAGLTAQAITAGSYHSCALLTGGKIKCWG